MRKKDGTHDVPGNKEKRKEKRIDKKQDLELKAIFFFKICSF